MSTARQTANVKWFSHRQKRKGKRKSSPLQIVALRLTDLATIFRSRYGYTLPDDDSGRDDIELAAHHLAALTHAKRRIEQWCRLWAPWLTISEQDAIIARSIANARPWTADQLAWRLRLTREERKVLGITTIGAIDFGKAARTRLRKERDRKRKAAQRRAQGVKPRQQYEASAISRAKPWEQEGISRATWYRRRAGTDTSPATA